MNESDIVVTIKNGKYYDIKFVQQIEKQLDSVLVKNGFTRTITSHEDDVKINYRQFAKGN